MVEFMLVLGFDKEKVESAITSAETQFPGDVEYTCYSFKDDWSNEPALLQERRHEADYDLGVILLYVDAANVTSSVESALESWDRIRNEKIAEDYLFSLLFGKPRG